MFTSAQISQQIGMGSAVQSHPGAYQVGYGVPQWRADTGTGMFNWGPFGPGVGDQFGQSALSGLQSTQNFWGAATMAGAGANMMGVGPQWLQRLGGANPFGFLGGAGGMMAGLGSTMIVGAGISALATGGMQQIGTNNNLMNMYGERVNMGGRGGLGMSRQAMKNVGDMTRELAGVPELMTSVGELSQIMQRMGDMQMLRAVKDASDFRKQFSDNIRALREISEMVGGTMEEALPLLQEARQAGIFGRDAQLAMIMANRASGMVGVGVSRGVATGAMMQGSNIAAGFGGNRAVGAGTGIEMLQNFSVAQQMGLLSEADVQNVTGQLGEQGLASLAGMTQQATNRALQSGTGRLLTAALGEVDASGRFTGRMDESVAQLMRSGGLSVADMQGMANKKLGSQAGMASFTRQKNRLATAATGALGFDGVMNEISRIMADTFKEDEDMVAIVAQRFMGGDERLADVLLSLSKDMSRVRSQRRSQLARSIDVRATEYAYRRTEMGDKMQRLGNAARRTFVDPINQIGANIQTSLASGADRVVDEIIGRSRTVSYTEAESQLAAGLVASGVSSVSFGLGDLGVQDIEYLSDVSGLYGGSRVDTSGFMGAGVNAVGRSNFNKRKAALLRAASGKSYDSMTERQQRVVDKIANRRSVQLALTKAMKEAKEDGEGVDGQIAAALDALKGSAGGSVSMLMRTGALPADIVAAVIAKANLGANAAANINFSEGVLGFMGDAGQAEKARERAIDAAFDGPLRGIMKAGGKEASVMMQLLNSSTDVVKQFEFGDPAAMAKEYGISQEAVTAMQGFFNENGASMSTDVGRFMAMSQRAAYRKMVTPLSRISGKISASDLADKYSGLGGALNRMNRGDSSGFTGEVASLGRRLAGLSGADRKKMIDELRSIDPNLASGVVQASFVFARGRRLKSGISDEDFLKEFGTNMSDVQNVFGSLLDGEDGLSSAERDKLIEAFAGTEALKMFAAPGDLGGTNIGKSALEESRRMMIQKQIEFVDAVSRALNTPALKKTGGEAKDTSEDVLSKFKNMNPFGSF